MWPFFTVDVGGDGSKVRVARTRIRREPWRGFGLMDRTISTLDRLTDEGVIRSFTVVGSTWAVRHVWVNV